MPVALWLPPKLALYLAMREQRDSNPERASRLGVHERVVRHMLDPGHATQADKIQAALAVLGKQWTVEVRDAAQRRRRILTMRPLAASPNPAGIVAADCDLEQYRQPLVSDHVARWPVLRRPSLARFGLGLYP